MKTNTFNWFFGAALVLPLCGSALAGDFASPKEPVIEAVPVVDPWSDLRRPITNPTHFDLAIPDTVIHPIFIHQRMPSTIDTILGNVPVGGDFQLYALQVELQLTERLSLNATKDGYIVFNPDSTLEDTEGFANLGAGLKYAWLLQPDNGLASNFQLLFEAPTGNDEVWQGNGDGVVIPSMNVTKLADRWQFIDQFGFKLPIDSAESTFFYNSAHVSYALTEWLFPVAELNYFKVLESGDGGSRFFPHAGGAVPAIATFEGGDLVNWGAGGAGENDELLTLGLGFRLRCPNMDNADVGFAREIPLTEEDQSIMKDRFTIDMVLRF